MRHFHVALVVDFLAVSDLLAGSQDADTSSTTLASCAESSMQSTSLDGVDTTTTTGEDSSSTEEVPGENGITCESDSSSSCIELEGTGAGIQHLLAVQPKSVPQRTRFLLKQNARLSVGTSRNAQRFPAKVSGDRSCWDDAVEDVLRHAGQHKVSRTFCILDIERWHRMLMQSSDPSRAGVQRTVTGARCGGRRFVPGPHVESALSNFVRKSWDIMQRRDISACGKAAWCCYHLVRIHPFSDGNGRLGRLLALWALRVSGFPLLVQLCAAGTDRAVFIEAFRAADKNHGSTLLLAALIEKKCELAAKMWHRVGPSDHDTTSTTPEESDAADTSSTTPSRSVDTTTTTEEADEVDDADTSSTTSTTTA
ncbi:unnamed protein product [Symbiodinium sp. CCMP2592]|nr:unnamed protein product [Symbiodinium sp. CCMP2592]